MQSKKKKNAKANPIIKVIIGMTLVSSILVAVITAIGSIESSTLYSSWQEVEGIMFPTEVEATFIVDELPAHLELPNFETGSNIQSFSYGGLTPDGITWRSHSGGVQGWIPAWLEVRKYDTFRWSATLNVWKKGAEITAESGVSHPINFRIRVYPDTFMGRLHSFFGI